MKGCLRVAAQNRVGKNAKDKKHAKPLLYNVVL